MNTLSASLLLMFCIPAVITQHTACYNYFLKKDRCVFAAQNAQNRCPAPPKLHAELVEQFTAPAKLKTRGTDSQFGRRYDTKNPSFAIASGSGICKTYDSTKELGVCLWSGTAGTAGWLNGAMTANCGQRVYIQKSNHPETVQYAKVLDGCSFDATTPETGCMRVGLSQSLFDKLNPTEEEKKSGTIQGGITWDFDNLTGHDPAQGPI